MTDSSTPIRASDRMKDVIDRDERLIDIIAAHSPQMAKFRNSSMRRTMARLTTVEQAARICRIPVDSLLRELNAALGIDVPEQSAHQLPVTEVEQTAHADAMPEEIVLHLATSPIELDVRDDLRNGREPFSRIMAAVGALEPGEVLRLRATFEPAPLFTVMQKRGFSHHSQQHGPEDWSVWFYRAQNPPGADATPTQPSAPDRPVATITSSPNDMVLDVRGMEPPEPMVMTLEALETLPAGAALLQINVRVPQLLLPILRERGFEFSIDQSHPDQVQVRIWRVQ